MKRLALVLMLLTTPVLADFFPEAVPEGTTVVPVAPEEVQQQRKQQEVYQKHEQMVQQRIKNSSAVTEKCVTDQVELNAKILVFTQKPKPSPLDKFKLKYLNSELAKLSAYCSK